MTVKTCTVPKFVKDIMTTNPVRITADTSAIELGRLLDANEISGVPVVDALDRVIGQVSKTDLLHRCLAGPAGSECGSYPNSLVEALTSNTPGELGAVEEFMCTDLQTSKADDSLSSAAKKMASERVHRLVVVDDQNHVLGIVTSLDMLKAFAN